MPPVSPPTFIPSVFNAGSTVKFTQLISDYGPEDGWTLLYALVMTGKTITWSGTDNGDGTHLINIPAATTANYSAGIYNWQSYVTNGADRFDIATGQIEVKPNFAAQQNGFDARSDTKIMLDAIVAVLKGRATKQQSEYAINGRSLKYTPLPDLIMLHKRYISMYRRETDAERKKQGKPSSSSILTKL